MPVVVNLNKARKQKQHVEAQQQAAVNRLKFGRTKVQKQREALSQSLDQRRLDLLQREPSESS